MRFEHPEEWEATQTDEQEEWLILAGDDGEPRVRLLVRFHEADDPLDERIESFIEELTDEDEGAEVERGGPVTLDNGSAAERAEIVRDVDGTSVLQRVQVTGRAGFTFVMVLTAPESEVEDLEQSFEAVLGSFESFPPAPYGVDRGRAFTMPLGEPRTMDPAVARETISVFFVVNVFSGLVRLGDDH